MKTKKAIVWILMMALMVSLLVGCSGGSKEPLFTSGGEKTDTAQRDPSKKSRDKDNSDNSKTETTQEEVASGEEEFVPGAEELAAITGTWYAEESYGYAELTIDTSGSFSWIQERPGEKAEVTDGTLQYEDGEADWGILGLIKGPRFEMYDEEGSFLQYALAQNDSGGVHDGKLAMLDGGGAWLYTREKPETKPEMETDGLALYEPVLEEVVRAFNDGYDFDQEYRYFPTGLIERAMYNAQNDALDKVGYTIADISGDGIPELLIGENMDVTGTTNPFCLIYGCYTVKNGEIIFTFEGYTRSSHTWLGNGRFSYWGANGAGNVLLGDAHLSKDGTELVWDDFYFSDTVTNNGGSATFYYHNTTGFYDVEQSERITEDVFSEITDMYLNDDRVQTLALTPLRSFGGRDQSEENLRIVGNWELRSYVNRSYMGYEFFEDGTWETYIPNPGMQRYDTVSTGTWEIMTDGLYEKVYRLYDGDGVPVEEVCIHPDEESGYVVLEVIGDNTSVYYGYEYEKR